MKLKDELQKIIYLQEFDTEIYTLKQKKTFSIPHQIENLNKDFAGKKNNLDQADGLFKKLQLRRKELELELASKESSIVKAQAQLYQLKTNKEYQAKLSEIASLKADVSLFEDNVLRIFDEIEKASKNLTLEKDRFVQEENKFKLDLDKINEEIKVVEDRMKVLELKRKDITKDVNINILSKYEKLLETRAGLAVVPIENDNCGACHMSVRPQTMNEIKAYEELISCGNCVRILYMPEDFILK